MANCDDIFELLKEILERVKCLEDKFENISIDNFNGTVSINNGTVDISGDVDSVVVNSIANGGVDIQSDVNEVHIDSCGSVDIHGDVENVTTNE